MERQLELQPGSDLRAEAAVHLVRQAVGDALHRIAHPDLHRVGGKYSDEWHRIHLNNPRDVVPESNMPAYPWLEKTLVNPADVAPRMKALRTVGVPYTDAQITAAADEVKGKTELDALIAYLQVMGRALK